MKHIVLAVSTAMMLATTAMATTPMDHPDYQSPLNVNGKGHNCARMALGVGQEALDHEKYCMNSWQTKNETKCFFSAGFDHKACWRAGWN